MINDECLETLTGLKTALALQLATVLVKHQAPLYGLKPLLTGLVTLLRSIPLRAKKQP